MGERPAEDSSIRNRVGGLDMTGPFAGSNPALGTMKEARVPDTPNPLFGHQQTPTLEFLQMQVTDRTVKAWVETRA